jgi:hypothetical protein
MGDLKVENQRLQKFADILDSQPELTFCIDTEGQITFMSDSALNYMKPINGDETDEDPTHISQILTGESVGTVLDSIAQIRADQCVTRSINGDHDVNGCISSVQVNNAVYVVRIYLKSIFLKENVCNINILCFIECLLSRCNWFENGGLYPMFAIGQACSVR